MKKDNETRASFLRRTAKEVKNYKTVKKILLTASLLVAIVLGIMYASSALYQKSGSFTVNVNKFEMNEYGLTLSETRDMQYKTSNLNADIVEDITNIAEESIPDNVDNIDGVHNGKNYIAYTFYVQNAGSVAVSYEYAVVMSGITNGLDEAIRLRLYVDGTPTTYAKTASDGSGPEVGTKEFYSASKMALGRVDNFEPSQTTRFTVVIWIEGNDPDCLDWLIGGKMKIEMDVSIVH